MSFLSRLPKPKIMNSGLESLIREYFGGGITSSGVAVNNNTAMQQMTVNNCIRVLYNSVIQMPCHLMEEIDGVKNKAKNHSLYRVIGKNPNGWMTSPQLWGLAIVHICLRGNFYAFKSKYRGGIRELLPIHPDRVQEVKQNDDWSLTYTINEGSQKKASIYKDYSQDDIFHIRGMSFNGYIGLNPIEYARESIALGLSSEKFLGQYFGKGLHPGAVVTHPNTLKDPQTRAQAINSAYSGLDKSHGVMILEAGEKIEWPTIKLVDAQFLEQMRFTEAQICGMYGVPLMLVNAGDNPETYASASEFKRFFIDTTIASIARNFETTIDKDCLSLKDQDTYYTKFNLNSLLRGNITERFAAYKEGINSEVLCPNECRDWEDLNPYSGGDEYRTRTSTIKESDKVKQDPNESLGDGGQ